MDVLGTLRRGIACHCCCVMWNGLCWWPPAKFSQSFVRILTISESVATIT